MHLLVGLSGCHLHEAINEARPVKVLLCIRLSVCLAEEIYEARPEKLTTVCLCYVDLSVEKQVRYEQRCVLDEIG